MFKIIDGNILNATEQYVAHQCNCKTRTNASGVAAAIFAAWPWSEVYLNRTEDGTLGSISVHGNGENERFVINMYAQKYPGGPTRYESKQFRLNAFTVCLEEIMKIEGLKSIALPHGVGCGLAGGDWGEYELLLVRFHQGFKDENVDVTLYHHHGG